ncbi:MAG: hypothetical protein V9F04_08780 [Dermatophilaceae bacterium]
MMQFFGLGAVLALLPVFSWSLMMMLNVPVHRLLSRAGAWFGGAVLRLGGAVLLPPAGHPADSQRSRRRLRRSDPQVPGALPRRLSRRHRGHRRRHRSAPCPALGLLAFAANLIVTSAPERQGKTSAASMPVRIVKAPAADAAGGRRRRGRRFALRRAPGLRRPCALFGPGAPAAPGRGCPAARP